MSIQCPHCKSNAKTLPIGCAYGSNYDRWCPKCDSYFDSSKAVSPEVIATGPDSPGREERSDGQKQFEEALVGGTGISMDSHNREMEKVMQYGYADIYKARDGIIVLFEVGKTEEAKALVDIFHGFLWADEG